MEKIESVCLYQNDDARSADAAQRLARLLAAAGFCVLENAKDADLFVCIGGDGTFLRLLRAFDYPAAPVVGINTGHLGFFQEFSPDELPDLVELLKTGRCSIQQHRLLRARVASAPGALREFFAINEICVRGISGKMVHLDMSIGASFIEHFSGDGLLFASPAGSTAYNYSAGGSISDPRVELLQVTPVAPMNTTVFRSFTSSLLLPADGQIDVYPIAEFNRGISLLSDGLACDFENATSVRVDYADRYVQVVRSAGYDFWAKVQSKFL